MFSAIKTIFSPKLFQEESYELYAKLVGLARDPKFYLDMQVPDTLDGRFDMIILQIFIAIQSIKISDQPHSGEIIRGLSEAFFDDMDRSLREMGSSDTGIGKRVKKMSQAYFGRLQAYDDAGDDLEKIKLALKRNVYRERDVSEESLSQLAQYVLSHR